VHQDNFTPRRSCRPLLVDDNRHLRLRLVTDLGYRESLDIKRTRPEVGRNRQQVWIADEG
jgi:hypothetical protein